MLDSKYFPVLKEALDIAEMYFSVKLFFKFKSISKSNFSLIKLSTKGLMGLVNQFKSFLEKKSYSNLEYVKSGINLELKKHNTFTFLLLFFRDNLFPFHKIQYYSTMD